MPVLASLLLLPLIEIALFVFAGSAIGFWPTIGLTVLTSMIGMFVLRRLHAGSMAQLRQLERTFANPAEPLAGMVMQQMGGVLLILPGFFTDFCGFLLLLPPVQRAIMVRVAGRVSSVSAGFGPGVAWPPQQSTHARDTVIDGDAVEIIDAPALPNDDRRPPSGWTRNE